jgi:hypothetical protein
VLPIETESLIQLGRTHCTIDIIQIVDGKYRTIASTENANKPPEKVSFKRVALLFQ